MNDDHVGTYAVCDPGGDPVWTERRYAGWRITDGARVRYAATMDGAVAVATVMLGPLRRVG